MRSSGDETRRRIRKLYRGVDGFDIPRTEEKAVFSSRGSPVYGEMMPAAIGHMIDYLELGERDVFYDLGSGSGKVVLQAAMSVPLRKSVGVELSATRVAQARAVLKEARRLGLVRARACVFRHQDLLEAKLDDATVIYTCSTAFSLRFMTLVARKVARLGRSLRFVTLQELEERRRFELVDVLRLDMSWKRRSAVYVYDVVGK